ncbi:MAG: putative phage tail protein [Solirubrobacterales bacterium]
MPAWSALTPLGERMLRRLPGWFQDDPDVRAVIHCKAKEKERQLAMAAQIRDDCIPLRASSRGLEWFEMYYELPVNPPGYTVEQRRTIILGHVKRDPPISSGRSWQEEVTALVGGGWTYEEHSAEFKVSIKVPFPPGSDPFEILRIRIPRLPSWPCHLELELSSTEGFILDHSQLDAEPFEGP